MELPINTIICGDCLEVMKDWPDNCVDLVLTDPPYGIGIAEWDKEIPSQAYFEEIFRISRNQMIFGENYFSLPPTESVIVWDKQPFLKQQAQCEIIWTSYAFKAKVITYQYAGNFENGKVDYNKKSLHPCEKPTGLILRLLDYSDADLIFDPFCGSGTTCVAAKMLGRNYIGIDISEEYCKIARMRIKAVDTGVPVKEQLKGQMGLFDEKNNADSALKTTK